MRSRRGEVTLGVMLAVVAAAVGISMYKPGAQLKLPEPVAKAMTDGTINSFYTNSSLYWQGSHVVSASVTCGGSTGTTTLTFEPAKTSDGLSKSSLSAWQYGYVLARAHNVGSCTPVGLFHSITAGSYAVLVAAPIAAGSSKYTGYIAAQGQSVPSQVVFQFCNHDNGAQSDAVEVETYDAKTESPCQATARMHKKAKGPKKGDDSSEPAIEVPQNELSDLLWIACARDCCPASSPPDTSMGRGRGRK